MAEGAGRTFRFAKCAAANCAAARRADGTCGRSAADKSAAREWDRAGARRAENRKSIWRSDAKRRAASGSAEQRATASERRATAAGGAAAEQRAAARERFAALNCSDGLLAVEKR